MAIEVTTQAAQGQCSIHPEAAVGSGILQAVVEGGGGDGALPNVHLGVRWGEVVVCG